MKYLILLISLFVANESLTQGFYGKHPLAHTYSIVAFDEKTGDMGVAVQSHWFSTGTIVTWGEAGVGVVATQSFVNPAFGPDGLKLMAKGISPSEALKQLIDPDEGKEVRQLALLNSKGQVAAFTGKNCIEAAGHRTGNGFSVQANLMANDKVWPAMAEAFEKSKSLPLAERMLAALEAAQGVGGDIRGKQSAALLVVAAKSTEQPWLDRKVDLRVDDHATPIKELGRLLKVHRAYEHMNRGDLAVEKGEVEKAMQEYSAAEKMFPENVEMKFWHAVTLTNIGKLEEALPLFKSVFQKNKDWKILTPRLLKNNLLQVDEKGLQRILSIDE